MYAQQRTASPIRTPMPTWDQSPIGPLENDAFQSVPLVDPAGPRALHASPDHIELGGHHMVQIGEHQLTTGEINALADYVADPQDLAALSAGQMSLALELIRRESLTDQEQALLYTIFPDYIDLSFDNSNHFAPSDSAVCPESGDEGPDHRSVAGGGLDGAIALAAEAGLTQDAEGLDAALAEAAFAGHFLADAFSSGHLFNKADVMAQVTAGLDGAGFAAEGAMIAGAATRIAEEGAAALSRWRVQLGPGDNGPLQAVGSAHLAALIGLVRATRPEVFGNGIVFAVHEILSEEGVAVSNGTDSWTMFGDEHLDPESATHCKALIEESYALVHSAFVNPDCVPSSSVILDKLPQPTESEQGRIHALIERCTTVEGGGMQDALVTGSLHQLDAILTEAGAAIPGVRFVPVDPTEAASDFESQGFESIGESTDECGIGWSLEDRGDGHQWSSGEELPLGPALLFGIDDMSLKTDAWLLALSEEYLELDLMRVSGQTGAWEDEDGAWGFGTQGQLDVVDLKAKVGDPDGEDAWANVGLNLLSIGSSGYAGEDGVQQGMHASAFEISAAGGSGWSDERSNDWALDLSAGVGVGESVGFSHEDADGDGVPELGFGVDLGLGPGFHIGVQSETLGWLAEGALDTAVSLGFA